MHKTETGQLTLAIESAIAGGSLSLIRGETEIASWTGSADRSKAEELLVNIAEMLLSVGVSRSDIGLIAVSAGPGSFTGIRIGIATALGLKTGLGIPMSSVSALEAIRRTSGSLPVGGGITVAVPVGRNAICIQAFKNGSASGDPRTVPNDDFGELLHDASTFVLHRILFEKYGSRPNTIDFGANIAYAIGLAGSPGVIAEPLFISKTF